MIIDHIRNREQYYALGKPYQQALDFFASVSEQPFEKTDILIQDSKVLVKARPMSTRPVEKCTFEAHHCHVDIHFVAYGQELIGYADVRKLRETSYDADQDIAVLEGNGNFLMLETGYFMITFPSDAHMPCICVGAPDVLGKMIAKIEI